MNVLLNWNIAHEERSRRIKMANQLRIKEYNTNGLLKHQQEMQIALDLENIDTHCAFLF